MLDTLVKTAHTVQPFDRIATSDKWLFGTAMKLHEGCRLTSNRQLVCVSLIKLSVTDPMRKIASSKWTSSYRAIPYCALHEWVALSFIHVWPTCGLQSVSHVQHHETRLLWNWAHNGLGWHFSGWPYTIARHWQGRSSSCEVLRWSPPTNYETFLQVLLVQTSSWCKIMSNHTQPGLSQHNWIRRESM